MCREFVARGFKTIVKFSMFLVQLVELFIKAGQNAVCVRRCVF